MIITTNNNCTDTLNKKREIESYLARIVNNNNLNNPGNSPKPYYTIITRYYILCNQVYTGTNRQYILKEKKKIFRR